ncbi:MAG: galactose-1-phosphate uridylyltransferase, partial [Planctomycetota bacterium]
MAELRRDPVSGRWVIIATGRAARPRDYFLSRGRRKGGFCPFCEGNEDRTPPEIAAIRPLGGEPNTPGWKVRVVPNKFPALGMDWRLESRADGPYHTVQGFGTHEVIVESARHVVSPTELATQDFELVLRMYCERSRALSEDERLAYVLIFKNVGQSAGASLEHSHSQLVAVPVMPKRVQEEMHSCQAFYEESSDCLFCSILAKELEGGERVVLEDEHFAVLTPFAS